MHHLSRLAACGVILTFLPTALAQQPALSVSSLAPSGNQWTITVKNTGPSTSFQLQGSPTLSAGSWVPVNATFAAVAGQTGVFRATFPAPSGSGGKYFFRVLGLSDTPVGTAGDQDGDGLEDSFETTIGTNNKLFDTDSDTFSDGEEFIAGTDPKRANSFPRFARLPVVRFPDSTKVVEEGAGVIQLPLICDNGSYTGLVQVETVPLVGGAVSGTDFTVPSTVSMSNGTANVPLTLIDNQTISQQYRVVVLQLKTPATSPGYTIGGGDNITVVIGDNDAYWSGVLDDGSQQRNFRIRMLRQGGVSQVAFVAGYENDGMPRAAAAVVGTTDQSSGVIPVGIFGSAVTSNTLSAFDVTSIPMPVGAQADMFGSSLALNRTLRLQAGTGVDPDKTAILPATIHGTFLETVAPPNGESPHLTVNRTGVFGLVRDIPRQPVITAP